MRVDCPLISIITPSYNRAGMISEAIESVLAQNYPAVEHIVVDGDSADETMSVLQRYPHLRVVTGQDSGMYDALNKGLKLAEGEIIGFLNTDDMYAEGTLGDVAKLFVKSKVDAVAGQAIYFAKNRDDAIFSFRPSQLIAKQNLWREVIYGDPVFNAWFFHRCVFDRVGNFDITYRIAGDRDFLMRFALSGLSYVSLPKVIYRYRVHNGSLSLTENLLQFSHVADENLRMIEHYWSLVPVHARLYLQRVRTRDTITAASRNLRGGAYEKALHYAWVGCHHDFFWPVKFLWRLFTGVFRVMGRRLGLYPPI